MWSSNDLVGINSLVGELPANIGSLTLEDTGQPAQHGETMLTGKRKRDDSDPNEQISKRQRHTADEKAASGGDVYAHPFCWEDCLKFFRNYAAPNDEIGPHGMERLCNDLNVDPTHIVMLVLAWKMQAKTMCVFTLAEWMEGMGSLECDSLEKLKGRLPYLEQLLSNPHLFKQIYRYSFDFAREGLQRSLDRETAVELLRMLMVSRWPEVTLFLRYLEQSHYQDLNRDQWYNVLDFAQTVRSDLSNYDENDAWPVLMDEYIAWRKEELQREVADVAANPMLEET